MKGLLKFITCGSVDDGKSTLIGHMLYDAKLLFTDQEQALELESKVGSREGKIDYSLLLDGLIAEREQGITIDVAYRYFGTEKRSFIVADTPGHEEYTRNMAVGASFADLAIILTDASKGVLTQTRRHTRICSLMGIKYFIFAINKMDLVDYSEEAYNKTVEEINKMVKDLNPGHTVCIPVCATEGDNITTSGSNMPWYKGMTLLECLETADTESEALEQGFVLPVQRVCRPNHTFRGFEGQVEAGSISVNDEVTVLPSGEKATVSSILSPDVNVDAAGAGCPVTLTLDREIDVSRGCVITKDANLKVSSIFRAELLWMDDTPLVQGKSYLLKIGTHKVPAMVMEIKHKTDINTGEPVEASTLSKNEIALCDITLSEQVVCDSFDKYKSLGCFILIDRVTNMTAGCGTVTESLQKSDNVTWQRMDITRKIRAEKMGQKPVTLWFTGLSGAGKSELANEVEKLLNVQGRYTMLLDGDNVRMGLSKNLDFSKDDRMENIRRIAEVSKLMNDAGLIVLTAFISPYISSRRMARQIIGDDSFIEIYVSTPLEVCEQRDVKKLYKKSKSGEIANFTGKSSPYEPPENPDITVDTSNQSIQESAAYVMKEISALLES